MEIHLPMDIIKTTTNFQMDMYRIAIHLVMAIFRKRILFPMVMYKTAIHLRMGIYKMTIHLVTIMCKIKAYSVLMIKNEMKYQYYSLSLVPPSPVGTHTRVKTTERSPSTSRNRRLKPRRKS